jgi:hypothetical protein
VKKLVGLWIDHEKAVIVTLHGDTETITTMESEVESHYRLSGGSRSSTPYGPEDVVSDKKPDERRKHQLHRYYRNVIAVLRDADSIFVLGPGEARVELEKEIRRVKRMAPKLAAVRRVDKMTDRQVAAQVREFFGVKR